VPDDEAKLVTRAEDFYRNAHRAYKDRDYPRSTALALAALDASRGLLSVLHASPPAGGLPSPPDLPAATPERAPPPERGTPGPAPRTDNPPSTPKDMARDLLRVARDRIIAAEKADSGRAAVKPFLAASRTVYERGRQAYERGDYTRALGLAAGAEAWSHIGEDLKRAEGTTRPGAGAGAGTGGRLPPPWGRTEPPRPRPTTPPRETPPER